VAGKSSRNIGRYPSKWSPSKKVLQEWRGLPEDTRPDRSCSVGEILKILLPKIGLEARVREEDISAAWSGIVGQFLATHSQPDRLIGGILHIRVIQSSVRYELDRTWRQEIIKKLREQFGEKVIRDIKFVL
jgi:predicted nucleic acid-binding Zn ribbon protein